MTYVKRLQSGAFFVECRFIAVFSTISTNCYFFSTNVGFIQINGNLVEISSPWNNT